MILYEYECANCKAKFQKFVQPENRHKSSCPGCGSKKIKKLWAKVSKIESKPTCPHNCKNCHKK